MVGSIRWMWLPFLLLRAVAGRAVISECETMRNEVLEESLQRPPHEEFLLRYRQRVCGGGIPAQLGENFFQEDVLTMMEELFADDEHSSSNVKLLCSVSEWFLTSTHGGCDSPIDTASSSRFLQGDTSFCESALRSSDVAFRDGFITRNEYQLFLRNSGFYGDDCELPSSTLSPTQSGAFQSLACMSCLETLDGGSLGGLPACCDPETARIALTVPRRPDWLVTICEQTASVALQECEQPVESLPVVTSSPVPPTIIESSSGQNGLLQCNDILLAHDVAPSDNLLSLGEYQSLVTDEVGMDCLAKQPMGTVEDEFRVLACLSCIPETPNLACCEPDVARVSIQAIMASPQSRQQRVFLSRICETIVNIQSSCETLSPSAAPQGTPAPVTTMAPTVVLIPTLTDAPVAATQAPVVTTVAPSTSMPVVTAPFLTFAPLNETMAPASVAPSTLVPTTTPQTDMPTVPTFKAAAPANSSAALTRGSSWIASMGSFLLVGVLVRLAS